MSLSDKQFEFIKDVALLIQYVSSKGWKITGGSFLELKSNKRYI